MTDPIFHPAGEAETKALVPFAGPVPVDTFGGRVHVEWDLSRALIKYLNGRELHPPSGLAAPA
jgi:hypothetical protein